MKESSGDILDKKNMRKTKGRKAILEVLKDSEPRTADDIFVLVKAMDEQISLSTVYRTCEKLAKNGIVLKTNLLEDGKTRYEYQNIDMEHHHHAVCMDCHKIIPIDECPFGEFDKLMESKYAFDVKSHKLEIYGYCPACKLKHLEKKTK